MRQSWRSWLSNDTHRVGPEWLQLVWTAGFAAAVALGFTLLGAALNRGPAWGDLGTWLRWYRVHFVISLAVALCIHALFAITIPLFGAARIQRLSGGQRALFFTAVPLVGVLIGWPLGVWLVSDTMGGWIRISAESATTSAVLALLISGIFFLFFNATARRMEAEKRATDAQLQLLQGQMEPHFLFNTLANVQSLMDHDLPRARQMLGDFTDHLRNSLGALRSDSSVVAQELALARSYLQLLQGRMEDRLRFEIDADEAALQQPLPPLLLQPLVENAVVHGWSPASKGAWCRSARGCMVSIWCWRCATPALVCTRPGGLAPDRPPTRGRAWRWTTSASACWPAGVAWPGSKSPPPNRGRWRASPSRWTRPRDELQAAHRLAGRR